MQIDYTVSIWNYAHYAVVPTFEETVALIRAQGWGIEFWGDWRGEGYLYGPEGRERIKPLVEGMKVSLHTAGARTKERMQEHVDTAAYVGAGVIVIHPDDVARADDRDKCDLEYTKWAVDYADKNGVRLALENGPFCLLSEALDNVDGLGFCFDVGHPYCEVGNHAGDFIGELKDHLIHIHLQDTLPESDEDIPRIMGDHYTPGTGAIPPEDWSRLVAILKEIDFSGTAVFEILPRNPIQHARLGRTFFENLLAG